MVKLCLMLTYGFGCASGGDRTQNTKEENDMKESKGIRLSALLMAMLLMGMAFVPAVSANSENKKNLLDISDLQSLSVLDIQDISEEQIESLMSAEQKELFKNLAKQEFSITEVGDDKIVTVPTIDANGKVSKQKVNMALVSKTSDTELYLVERGVETECVVIQHIGKDVRVTGYAYDPTKAETEYDVAALLDHGDKKYEVWTEGGYLRIWLSPLLAAGGATSAAITIAYAIILVLAAAGITISSGGVIAVVALAVAAAYMLYGNPDGSLDLWLDLDDIATYALYRVNQWPYDFGIIDVYAGSNGNHYIPIPYGPV